MPLSDNSEHHNALKINAILDNKYKIISILGSGGFGITYLAVFTKLDQKVVIKEYFPNDLAQRDTNNSAIVPFNTEAKEFYQKGKERFLFEAKTIAKFKHPYIVRIIDYFETNNSAYFVMDYEEGEDLGEYLKKHQFTNEEEILPIIVPILDALSEIHSKHIYHRDIKPDNIYLRKSGGPMLIDFGAAKESFQEGSKNSSFNPQTAGYAAPEQKSSIAKYIGAYTDLYALGAVLHKIVTGKTPPKADDRSISRDNEGFDNYKPLAEQNIKGFSKEFLKNIDWSLQLLSKDRPQTTDEFKKAIMSKTTPKVVKKENKIDESKEKTRKQNNEKNREIEKRPKDKKNNKLLKIVGILFFVTLLIGIAVIYQNNNNAQLEKEQKIEALQNKLQQEKARAEKLKLEKEKKARAEKLKLEKEKKARAEKLRLEKEKKARAEKLRLEKEKKARAEKLRLEKEKKARAEKLRLEKEKKARAEKLRLEKEKKARAEKLRLEKEKKARAEKLRQEIYYVKQTGLMWQDNSDAQSVQKDWSGAKEYCKNLTLGGYSDWYLPSYNQLLTLVDYTKSDPAIKNGIKNVASKNYWSSSENVVDSSYAWDVYVGSGSTSRSRKTNKYYVRCVRGRQ